MATKARSYQVRELLKDGTEVTVRAMRPEDAPDILAAFGALGRDSIYRRFFTLKKTLSAAELKQLAEVDFETVVALVVTTKSSDGDVLIAGGRYALEPGREGQAAELAFLTSEAYRGLGLASVLLRHLAVLAKDAGLGRFEAEVLAENQPMLNVFRHSGLPLQQHRDGSTVHVTLSLI
jgi:RimJ/RimL family protein N-acetyltransferase